MKNSLSDMLDPKVENAPFCISFRTCEDPRPHAWSMCAACLCSCIFLSRATPLGRSRTKHRNPFYWGTSLIRKTPLLGPNSRTIQAPMVVLGGGAVSYERGTPVAGMRPGILT